MEQNIIAGDLKQKTLINTLWKFVERVGSQVVSFVVQIVLARILMPDEFGLIALVTIFIALFDVFVSNGLATALIQKKSIDEEDCSSVFTANVALSILLYILLFICAPFLSQFYENDTLTPIIRVLGFSLILSSIKSVQQAIVSKRLQFRLFFYATISGTIVSAIVGVIMDLRGAGVWALVAQYLVKSFVDICVLFVTMKWKPQIYISISRIKPLFNYGWKILLSAFIDSIAQNIRDMIIGKMYSPRDLAYYNRGKMFPTLVSVDTMASLEAVLFPIVSSVQDDKLYVKQIVRRFVKDSSYILIPLLIGLAIIAEPLVRVVLTDKWLPCVPYLQIFCVAFCFKPLHMANMQMIKAVGRSDITLKMEVIKKVVGISILLLAMKYGVIWIALSTIISDFLVLLINGYPSIKLINYKYSEQFRDLAPSYILSLAMAASIYPLSLLNMPDIVLIIIQIICGLAMILFMSVIFKVNSYYSIKTIIITNINRKRSKY